MALASMWASLASWCTPSVLFCVINLMVVTIFIASNFKFPHGHHQNSPAQPNHPPSSLERVNSSFFHNPESETTGENSVNQLGQTPSLLERVKSIDFSFSSFYSTPPDQSHPHDDRFQPESEQTHNHSPIRLARAPSVLERVKSISLSSFYAQNDNPLPSESQQFDNSPGELARTPSLLDRVKSFKVPYPFNSNYQSGDTFSSQDEHADLDLDHDSVHDHEVASSKSKKSSVTRRKKSSGTIKKSNSEKKLTASDDGQEDVDYRRPATMKASYGDKDDSVDAKADDFINRFKQQLKLQRLDSLRRFKDMLNRGT